MCEICGGFGFYRRDDLPVGHPQFGKLIPCDCKAKERSERLQILSGLTSSERKITLDQIDLQDRPGTAEMVHVCESFISCPYGIVTFWGGSGNAKTMALQAVINAEVAKGREAVYITAFDLFAYIKAAFSENDKGGFEIKDETAYQRLSKFEKVSILAIDEFDKVRFSEWVREQITDLIDKRHRLGLDEQAGTLIAMNDDPHGLPSWIYSRLAQNIIVHNPDEDMRPMFGEFKYANRK